MSDLVTGLSISVDKYGSITIGTAYTLTVYRSPGTDSRLVDQMLAVLTEAKAKLTLREEQHRQAEAAGFSADHSFDAFDAWYKGISGYYGLVRTGTSDEAAPFYWSRRTPFCSWLHGTPIPAMTLDEALDACLQDLADCA